MIDPESLLRAQGVALASLEALLIHKGVLELGELATTLEGMSQTTGRADPQAGEALAAWAEMLGQVDEVGATRQ